MRIFLSLLATAFLGLIAAGLAIGWGLHEYSSAGPLSEATEISIPRGSGVSSIAMKLEDEGVISYALLFKIAVRLQEQQSRLKAGEYAFPAHISMQGVMDKLVAGDIIVRQVTIPEGFTSFEIIEKLKSTPELEPSPELIIPEEGSLLPGTYRFQKGQSAADIITEMQSAMTKALNEAWEKRSPDLPFSTKEEALILASVIEKETAQEDERNRIAGVFVNRLEQGIPLQTDPTVIYAITKGREENEGMGPLGRRLLTKDLKIDSPYNTYLYAGLPPGPICNPGIAAIEAALHPEDNDYIFFVADGTGGHVFSKTLKEHENNRAKWRKIRREQSQKTAP